MNCQVCGASMHAVVTDLPFKLSANSIAIVKNAPVLECSNCREYMIEDGTMERIEKLLDTIGENTELGVVDFAA